MPFAELPAGRFFYEEEGAGDPVIFSHGIYMDHTSWSEQLKGLSDAYRCIAWDARNHGETEVVGALSYWDHAADLVALLDHLGIDQAVLVGMSQGGFLSLRAAIDAPERVRALVMIDSQAGLEDPIVKESYATMVQDWLENGPSELILETVAQIINGPDIDNDPWIEKWRSMPDDRVQHAFGTLVERDDVTERLGEIRCPALVIHGDQDMAVPMERARALAEGLASCDGVEVVRGAGHSAQMAAPQFVNDRIQAFLTKLA